MIELKYELLASEVERAAEWDLESEDEYAFTNNVFEVTQTFRIDQSDFSLRTFLIWFVWELSRGISELAQTSKEYVFYDSESGDSIRFIPKDDLVLLSANYTDATAMVPLAELQVAMSQYAEQVWNGLSSQFPAINKNRWLAEHYPLPGPASAK